MNTSVVVVEGMVKEDGTLEVETKLALPAGPVQVTIVPMQDLPKDDPFWLKMQAIWAGQKARGYSPRSRDEVVAERQTAREEWEERMRRIEQIQVDADAARKARSASS